MTGVARAPAPPAGTFAEALIDWQRRAGRHDLPWQRTLDPYRIWVSEIMLQQTQVATVLGYYGRFLERFPDVRALAAADPDEVLGLWSGLGYYSRARNLLACARAVVERHGGTFPSDPVVLEALPGIGRSTAAAIAAFAWGVRAPILDGNVRRVLCRAFGVEGWPGERAVEQRLWAIAERELPAPGEGRIETYTQALMDMGATVCVRVRPRCGACPAESVCVARAQGRTDALPAARPVRAVEVRDAEWVLPRRADAVLLERRSAAGLWGGLWSPPELRAPVRAASAAAVTGIGGAGGASTGGASTGGASVDAAAVAAWGALRFGWACTGAEPIASVRHAFTHFRLRARVWALSAPGGAGEAPAPAGHVWLPLDEVPDAPLPAPVRTLLEGLRAARRLGLDDAAAHRPRPPPRSAR